MGELTHLRDAIDEFVDDGSTMALEGFTHLIPFAAAHEIIRQEKVDLTVMRMTPDVIYDQLVGVGAVGKMIFSWGGNPGVGSLHRVRDAIEHGCPRTVTLEEHTHAGMTVRYAAGAAGLPFGVLRGYVGTDLMDVTSGVALVECPFSGEELAAVSALTPDVGIIHAQQSDRSGNVAMWGITGVHKEVALASTATIITVEEVVDELRPPGPNPVIIPSWVSDAVALVPGGAHPSYAMGYSRRDNGFYRDWDAISRDRGRFEDWIATHVRGVRDHAEHLASIGVEGSFEARAGG